jgi:hypothetical protein
MRMLANPGAFVLVVDLRGAPAAHLDLGTAYIDSATSATNITSQLRAAENTSCELQRAGK